MRPLRSYFLCSSALMVVRKLKPALAGGRPETPALNRHLRATALGSLALLASAAPALAQTAPGGLPSGGAFIRGEGVIGQTSPTTLGITQSSDRGVIDWRAFSIATGHQVNIDNGQGATLNRVLGGQISQIEGMLTSTGSVYLMNPNGVIVGPGGRVITNGNFVASTREMNIDAFMAGGPLAAAGRSDGAIVNRGEVISREGSVVMIARSVTNSGLISAPQGRVTLAAADDVLLTTTDGDANGIFVSVGSGGGDITQEGRIQAAAVALQAAHGNIFALAGNREGLIQATGTATIDGQLWLTAPEGSVEVEGRLVAADADGTGGEVLINGRDVRIASSAHVAATGSAGGEVLIGASGFGTGEELADHTSIESGATILAGGPSGGGRIETSGRDMSIGSATILAGDGGEWLLDPDDLIIDAPAASTMTTALNAGTDVTQATTAGGVGGVGDITVAAPVVWTGAGDLTLNAFRDVVVNSPISGGGGLTLIAGRNALVGAAVSGSTVNVTAASLLRIAAIGQISSAGNIRLTTGTFTNLSGADALASSGGNWLVYSANPASDVTGGLVPDFYQYNAAAGAAPAAAGDGLLYSIAPSVSFTPGTVTRPYDGTTVAILNETNTTVTGLINNDDFLLDGQYATKNAGTGISVTATNFRATHNGIPVFGYLVPTPSVTVNTGVITRALLTASIVGNPTKTYNASTTATLTAANYSLAGVAAGETITINGAATVAYNSPNAGARTVNATFTTPNFTLGAGVDLNNYVLPTTATGAGLINQAPLQLTNLTANSRVYDGTTVATLNTANTGLFGIVTGDTVTLNSAGAVGIFATRNVGTGIAVTASGFTLAGASAANYTLVSPPGLSANITPATLNVLNLLFNDKVYDGTTIATPVPGSATVSGRIAGDAVTISTAGASINFVDRNVGQNIPITVSGLSLAGADAGNYVIGLPPASLTGNILPAPLFAAIIGNPTKVYDATTTAILGASNYILTGFAAGEGAVVTQTAGATYNSPNAGTRLVSVQVTPPDFVANPGTLLSNYILPTSASGLGTINPAPLLIAIIGNPTKAYDGNAIASLAPGNFLTLGFLAGQGATVTQTQGLYASSDAGLWTVTADVGVENMVPNGATLLSNYIIPATAEGPGTITRRDLGPLVLFAAITGNPTKIYDGNTIATLTPEDYTIDGFLAGESAIITETVGEYDDPNAGLHTVLVLLTPDDFLAGPNTNLDNYNLPDQATGIGTILRAPLTAAIIGNPTRVYNGSTFAQLTAANYSFTGLVSGETITVLPQVAGAYDSDNAGARTVTAEFGATSFSAGAGTRLVNYILPTEAVGPGTITPAPLLIIGASAISRVYDTTNVAQLNLANADLFGVVAGDIITLNTSGASATFATPNVGTNIAVTATGFSLSGLGLSNYQLFQPTGLFANITPKGVSILNVLAQDKVYDATTAAILNLAGASLSGVFAGDTVGFSSASAAGTFQQSNVGVNLSVATSGFSLTGADAGNYTLSQPGGLVADITPRPLTGLIINNPTKTYDGTTLASLAAGNFALTGFVAGQGGRVTQASNPQYALADAGTRIVTANLVVSDFVANAGTNLANYLLPTSIQGPGTINRATLTAQIIGNPTRVYNNTTVATLTSANYLLSGFVGSQGATVTETVGAYNSPNVGSRTVTATLAANDFTGVGATNLANYILPVSASGAGTITPASVNVINVTALNKIYDGTTVAQLNTLLASLAGVFAGDAVNVVSTGATGTFATRNVGLDIPVTATGFTIAGADALNYTVVQPTGLFADIAQAQLTVASVTRVYNAGVNVPTVNSAYTLGGVFGSDNVFINAAGIGGSYDNKNVGTGKLVNLTGVALGGTDAANYLINPIVINAPIGVITPATLNIIGVLAADKVYDRTTLATLINGGAALSGVLGVDNVVLNTTGSSGTFNDFNVGQNKPVTAIGYTVTGVDAGNYTLVQPQGVTADITPRPITLTSVLRVYTGDFTLPTAASGYGFTGVLAGDTVTANVAGITGGYATRDVAGTLAGGVVTNGISVNIAGLSLSGAGAGNYSIAPTVVGQPIGVITPKALTAAIVNNPTRTYDRTTNALLAALNFQLTGFVAGQGATVTETVGQYNSINAGARTVTAALAAIDFTPNAGTLLTNYILPTSASGPGTINPAPLTIAGVLATDRVYNGTTLDVLNVGSASLVGVFAGDTVALNSAGAVGNFATPDVGLNKPVTATGFALLNNPNGNYILSQPTGLFADITAALLNLVSVTRVYTAGTELPTASSAYVLGGFVAGDDVSVNTANIAGNYQFKNVGTGINVTLTGLALGGADGGNYSIANSLTNAPIGVITPATVSLINVVANSRPYDGTTNLTLDNSATAIVGRLGTDVLGVNSAGSTASFPSANVGSYLVDASGYVLTGADAPNYILTQPTDLSASITPAQLTAFIIGNPTRVYDGTTLATLTTANFALSGFAPGEGVAVTQTGGRYASPDAGVRVVTAVLDANDFSPNSATLLSNYILPTTAAGPGRINPAALTAAIIGNPTRIYDGTNVAALTSANYQLTGFIAGQGATVTETVGAYSSPNAGARTVTATLGADDFTATGPTLLSNYVLPTTASGAGTINPKALIATIIGNPTRVYDGTNIASLTSANFALTGFVAGQGAVVTETSGLYSSTHAGPRTVTATLATGDFTAADGSTLLSNYILPTGATGAGTIDRRTVAAAIIGDPTRAYDGTTVADLTAANFSLSGFVAGEGASVTETVGTYADPNAGPRTVSATLALTDFSPTGVTLLSDYILPTTALGQGHIDQATLTASIIGIPTRIYDATTVAVLTPANYALDGFAAGEGATVTQTAGTYASPNAGLELITAFLAAGDFTAGGGTLLSNYILPTSATGMGEISKAPLTLAIVGDPTRLYDGTRIANLTPANYAFTGFVAGQGAVVLETRGFYDSSSTGLRNVFVALGSADFAANRNTLLTNYELPLTATGTGHINPVALTAAIIGTPTRVYNGTTLATLTSANFSLTGFVAGESATVTETVGNYATPNVGIRQITAALDSGDFIAGGGTSLGNYILPTIATGPGRITQAMLTAAIIGNPTRAYDATNIANLLQSNFLLTGFVAGEGAVVTETLGIYASPDAGVRSVTAALERSDFSANAGTLLANYILPTSATGFGTIDPRALNAAIIGNPARVYDGTSFIGLTSANFSLTGFVAGQGAVITETTGAYDSPNAGPRTVSAALDSGDFSVTGTTLLSNYILPTTASGPGRIDRAALAVALVGNPTRGYDGTTIAALTSGNFALTGFVAGEGAGVTETVGAYDSPNAGPRTVTASLDASDFAPVGGTLLTNYILPTSATGPGQINLAALTAILTGVSRTYDGTTLAVLNPGNYVLSGFASGEGAVVTETVGLFASPNAGDRTVTAALEAGDFTATGGTVLSNYVLPTSAIGTGRIDPALLNASIIGSPTRIYDGTTLATLTSGNFALSGFITGEGATITETVGTYDSPNAGVRVVTAVLGGEDFAANAGTLMSNYVLPASATGPGQIDQAALSLALIGVTRTYNGTAVANLTPTNFALTGFIPGEGALVTETIGTFASPNAGVHDVVVVLDATDYAPTGATLMSNYILPTGVTGLGEITRALLTASIVGNPTRVYDGTAAVALTSGNFQIDGFVAGEGALITETAGLYDSTNAGSRTVTATLSADDYVASGGTLLSNYVLPVTASGPGTIDRATVTVSITGNPTRVYDGTIDVALTSDDYTVTGFIPGEGAFITETRGVYDDPDPGERLVTAFLGLDDYSVTGSTLLSNYNLPTTAEGPGEITPLPNPDCTISFIDNCLPVGPSAFLAYGRITTNPRFYIPYPVEGLYAAHTNGFGGAPTTTEAVGSELVGPNEIAVDGGLPVINSTEGILLQGARGKRWTIRFAPRPTEVSLGGLQP
ncbi:YDG domain-containing protein [Brevundimonas lenta]|uniref:Filamentous hemagglutinin family protein n=1 Tax=Brevundimonas lenta TaxID=424796 RepID=A0A7W6NQI2_9CAUL|nr:YDG domain-containing protein [Brevundimonas lenta]MBB4083599.1 filamentous hemagglutinin family protein [Brevundimonas lenta]